MRQKNVTDYVKQFERITTKLFHLQNKTEDTVKFQRYLKNTRRIHKAFRKYVSIGLYGYKLRQ